MSQASEVKAEPIIEDADIFTFTLLGVVVVADNS